ncbi:MAG: tetratricopeptide repeat protein [Anaerolineaceae bacterium]|nr:tetratricopeptide repeat protein [Anaerolineaceae bacterium]
MSESLRDITALIRQKNFDEARSKLQAFLKQNPQHAEAWYMLSFVARTPEQRAHAAQQAARLEPKNERYLQQVGKLALSSPTKPSRSRLRWILPVALLIAIIVMVVIALLSSSQSPDAEIEAAVLPTLAELPSVTPSPEPTDTEQPTNTPVPSPTPEPSTTPTATDTVTPTKFVPTLTTAVKSETTTLPLVSPSPEVVPTATTQVVIPPPTTSSLPTLPPPPTDLPPTEGPSPTPTLTFTPPPTLVVVDTVPVGIAQAISGGQLRVLEATRPGETLMRELAGSVPPTPANHNWVVVELLLVCSGADNCTPPASAFVVQSNIGATYSPAATLNLQPIFAPDIYLDGQTWGYLGFIVPTSDTGIWLKVDTGAGESINFALQ